MPEGHIFLSYRSIESDFALKLAADLKNTGVKLWMDRLDGIQSGDNWQRQIEKALTREVCALMIAILSPEYLTADYCQKEMARASRLKIPILPILLYPVQDIPLAIEGIHYLPFCSVDNNEKLVRTWREESFYNDQLVKLLNHLPSAQIGTIPDIEFQYLTSLIAELESRKGILEYIELSAQADAPKVVEQTRPEPRREDEWGVGFSLLLDRKQKKQTTIKPTTSEITEKLTFKSISEAVIRFSRFVLIGEPGAGKTTAIRQLALNAARKRLDNPRIAPIPLLLYLPQWDDEVTPIDFVHNHWPFDNDIATLLRQGNAILYLDGLNEMGVTGIHKAKQLSQWLIDKDGPQNVVITSRASDYVGDLKMGEMPTVVVEHMDEAQIREFSKRYLGEKAKGFLAQVIPEDYERYGGSRNLFDLAKNPYLLTALIVVYLNDVNGVLPRNYGILFQRLVRCLWERERINNTLGWIPLEQMESSFAFLAFSMVDEGKSTYVPMKYVLKHVLNENLLKATRSANLIDIKDNQVRFYHQLIQEYFASLALFDEDLDSILSPLEFEDMVGGNEFRDGLRVSSKWDEVIIAFCGITQDASEIIKRIAELDPILAAYCLASGLQTAEPVLEHVVKKLIEIIDYGWPSSSIAPVEASRALKSIGKNATTTIMNRLNLIRYYNAFEILLDVLDEIGETNATDLLLKILDDNLNNEGYWTNEIVQSLGRIADNKSLPTLINLLGNEEKLKNNQELKKTIIISLGRIRDTRAISNLTKILLNDSSPDIRGCVALALGMIGTNQSVPYLINCLSDEELTWDNKYGQMMFPSLVQSVCDIAAEGLTRIGTPEALAAVQKWRTEQRMNKK